jgi:hypothetical protein
MAITYETLGVSMWNLEQTYIISIHAQCWRDIVCRQLTKVETGRNFEVVYQFILPDLYSQLFFRWNAIPHFGFQEGLCYLHIAPKNPLSVDDYTRI